MTFKHLYHFIKDHPISLGSVLGTVLAFSCVGLAVALASRVGFNADQAAAIISENKAPKTLELVGTITLALLLLRSIAKGPSGIPNGVVGRWLITGLPSVVVSIAAAFFGVTLGSTIGFICWDIAASQLLPELKNGAVLLVFSYCMALVLTADKTTAPAYAGRGFKYGYQLISFLLLLALLGRSWVLLLFLSRGNAP